MHASALVPRFTATPATHLDLRARVGLAVLCLCAAVAPLAARWTPDLTIRITCGVLVALVLLGFGLVCGRLPPLRPVRELSWALFVFALVQVLNNSIPHFVVARILAESPTNANPLASSISGSVVVQLVDTAIAIVPIL